MGKAIITDNLGDGRYHIRILWDRGGFDRGQQYRTANIEALAVEIDRLEEERFAKATARNTVCAPDGTSTACIDATTAARAAELSVQLARARFDALKRDRKFWEQAMPDEPIVPAWCADLSADMAIGDVVGTVETPGETVPAGYVQIRPGFEGAAAYSEPRDYMITPAAAADPFGNFVNRAIMPGWQKWKPTFRHGTLTAIDSEAHTGDVSLDATNTSLPYGGANVNAVASLSGVPIEYMECHSAAFEAGDHVLVEFLGQEWNAPKIIGFYDNPKGCGFYVEIWANGAPGPAGEFIRFWSEADEAFSSPYDLPENGIIGPFVLDDLGNPQLFAEHERFGRNNVNLLDAEQVMIDPGDGSEKMAYRVNFSVSILLSEWTFGMFRLAMAWDVAWDRPAELDGFTFPLIVERFPDWDRPELEPESNDKWKAYRSDALERAGNILWTFQEPRVWNYSYGKIIPEIPYCGSGDACICGESCHSWDRTESYTNYDSVDNCNGGTWTEDVSGHVEYDNGCGLCERGTLKAIPRNFSPRPDEMYGAFWTNEYHRTGTQDWEKEYVCEDGRWGKVTSIVYNVQYDEQKITPMGPFPVRSYRSIGGPPVASGAISGIHGGGSYTDTEIFQAYVDQGCNFSGWGDAGESPPESWIVDVKIGYKQVEDTESEDPNESIIRLPKFEAALSDAIRDVLNTPENIEFEWAQSAWYLFDPTLDYNVGPYHLSGGLTLIDIVRPGAWADMVKLHNDHRAALGLDRLTWNAKLAEAAGRHADDIAANLLESHYGSDGSDPMERIKDTGYYSDESTSWLGYENIAFYSVDLPVEDVFDGWLASTEHRETIEMAGLEEIGIAAAVGSDGRRYYVVCFGQVTP